MEESNFRYKIKLKNEINSRLIKKSFREVSKNDKKQDKLKISTELENQRSFWEAHNNGGYEKIYPSENYEEYEKYFQAAIQIWESLTGTAKKKTEEVNKVQVDNISDKTTKSKSNQNNGIKFSLRYQTKRENLGLRSNKSSYSSENNEDTSCVKKNISKNNFERHLINMKSNILTVLNDVEFGTKIVYNQNIENDKSQHSLIKNSSIKPGENTILNSGSFCKNNLSLKDKLETGFKIQKMPILNKNNFYKL